jgi:hypothetical protein
MKSTRTVGQLDIVRFDRLKSLLLLFKAIFDGFNGTFVSNYIQKSILVDIFYDYFEKLNSK